MPVTTMILAPNPVQQFTDSSGNLLVGGLLYLYAAGTTTKQAAFTSSGGGTALPNPVVLNARGEVAASSAGTSCGLWLDPTLSYKMVLAPATDTDPPSNPFWTVDNVVSPQSAILAALATYEASVGGTPVGSMMSYAGATRPAGWLLCYGQAISRTTYAALFAAIGIAYGSGDGSTTFNVPDRRGRASIGADNMGGAAANRVTNAVSGVNAALVGASGGSQNAQQDTLTAANVVNSIVTDNGHLHPYTPCTDGGTGTSAGGRAGVPAATENTSTAYTGIAVTTTVTTTVTSGLTGTSQNMMPVLVDNVIIYTAVP